ncbi:zinc-dependent metalloprotease [Cryobacterium sp. TMT1-21]|uniref:Zinc-dependent metalloprotease n=2 Tax=Cryobacterium TaxID=69578 RepID=A0AAQ2HG97_9MICO|nr:MULTISPECIES: zinc-dependent metalloprotease [Cryobacterium]TFC50165.1 zinc-dependent metalloprotease [Cryobacterium shii]TFC82528.1 zinc-dependent metalloprotease [Cryobacterium sp. TmT2-59]TFD15289.1 zinc-dependent metalloprotease [Cryobacterium sp. TMT4-10]TFD18116.1 zinc-dependent metalloprotease [Cryobacterium sp. TMT1-21]TFD25035.1 zinc-dependent metalloprotease [Cryobacterium sp. TMT2-23]
MLRDILSGKSSIDPSQLAGAAGLPSDPVSIAALMNQLQGALRNSGDGAMNWDAALSQGQERAANGQLAVTDEQRTALDQAFHIAALWLDEVISVAELTTPPKLMTRKEWVTATMPLWTQLAEPVATSISDSLTRVLTEQAPEELKGMMAGASQVMRSIGGTLFAMQLGQVVGQLSSEVVSGGDVGIPLLSDQQAALLPQNVAIFGEGLDVPDDQVQIYLAVRELAHARLFRHSRWLRLHLISSITDFARGIHIDSGRLEELADGFDPSNPEELREAMVNGSLIPPKSESQLAALARLETMLALIEGWVDVVTLEATSRLPRADAIAETVKRRRASGGPAESAFATLVGLELRPRRLREAAAMWQAVTDAVGNDKRDELWAHPDLLPTSADLDAPQALVARLTSSAAGAEPVLDEVDQALEDLLRDDGTERPHEE